MGKRNVRIPQHQLQDRLPEILGREVHVIMQDGKTHFGTVRQAQPGAIALSDANAAWTSRRRHMHQLPIQQVMEVIFDNVSTY